MAVDAEEVRELVDFAPEGYLVTSFYLDVNAKEFPDADHVNKSVDSLLHAANEEREKAEQNLSHDASESLRADLAKIEEWVKHDFQREDTNGLAIFSCSALDFWQVVQMPTAVTSQVTYAAHPRVAPIATYLSHNKPTAVLVASRGTARILTVNGVDVREWADLENFVPQRSQQGGWSQSRYQRRNDNFSRHNIDQATELVLKLKQIYPFDWLVLAAEVQGETMMKESLHPYLQDTVIGTVDIRADAPVSEIVESVREVIERAESERIDMLMAQVQEYAGAGGRGTIGLETTLQAVNEQKVHILLVQEGYTHPGAVCPNCGVLIAHETDTCPACGGGTEIVEDVVERAIERAFELDSIVEVATEYNKLEPIQFIGSIMYY